MDPQTSMGIYFSFIQKAFILGSYFPLSYFFLLSNFLFLLSNIICILITFTSLVLVFIL